MSEPSNSSSVLSSIHAGAFVRTLLPPLIVWGGMVAAATLAGQPGIICVTPMAWLLALWCGGHYIHLVGGVHGRRPLLGPGLLGAALGLCMGVMFILVSTFYMPVGPDPDEASRAQVLYVVLSLGGVIICTLLSLFTGWLTMRRY